MSFFFLFDGQKMKRVKFRPMVKHRTAFKWRFSKEPVMMGKRAALAARFNGYSRLAWSQDFFIIKEPVGRDPFKSSRYPSNPPDRSKYTDTHTKTRRRVAQKNTTTQH